MRVCIYVVGVVEKPSAAWGKKRQKKFIKGRLGAQVNRPRVKGPAPQRFWKAIVYTKDPRPALA